jgi:hypothetical protein
MKRQILRSLSIPLVTLVVVFATSVLSANAQTSQRVNAQVPFDFIVGDKTLCAGKYSISSAMQGGSALLVQNVEAKIGAIRLTDQVQTRSNKTNPRLVFHRYGQTYFLAEVWQGGDTGRALHASKTERALRRERSLIAQTSYETVELIASR